MNIVNLENDVKLVENCKIAKTFFSRGKGLLGVKSISNHEALLIVPCNSVHTFFMKFSIDVAFISKEGVVVDIISTLKPWRVTKIRWKAHAVLELPSGKLSFSDVNIGDRLCFLSKNKKILFDSLY